jgi:hypothetical protein
MHFGITFKERYINKVIINSNDIPPTYVEIPVVGNLNKQHLGGMDLKGFA